MFADEAREVEGSGEVYLEGEPPEVKRMWLVISTDDLHVSLFALARNLTLTKGRTFAAVPIPAQLMTPPSTAPVSFTHPMHPSTAACTSALFVMSVFQNLTRELERSFGGRRSRMAMYAFTLSSASVVARPRPDELSAR
jgi:hypothetical protein